MTSTWIALVTTALVTFAVAPLVRRTMLRAGIMDVPNHRSSHTLLTPRGGGLACGAGAVFGNAAAGLVGVSAPWLALSSAVALGLVGFLDDRHGLAPLPRLGAQAAVGAALGAALGDARLALIGVLLFPLLVNTVNFMDGINGISGTTMVVWGATMLALGILEGSAAVATVGGVAAGMGAGFLPWNVPHAKLFLGDVGSYLFGAFGAAGLLVALNEGVPVIAAAAPLAVYLADVAYTLLRRARRGAPLTEAHREHVYQRIVHSGRATHATTAILVGTVAGLSSFAWLALSTTVAFVVTAVISVLYLSIPKALERRPK